MGRSDDALVSRTNIGLKPGDSGAAVGALQRYLRCFGYLPFEATLEERSRRTREAAVSEVFDGKTLEGLRAYQAFNGIPVTGLLDEATVTDMEGPRCGFPDILREDDPSFGGMRFSLSGYEWHRNDLRYAFENFSADSTRIRIQRAVSAAFRVWSEVTPLTFQRLPSISENTEIELRFIPGDRLHGSETLAYASFPPDGDITFLDGYMWNTSSVVPEGEYDLQSVATHEIGHALGLQHTTVHGAVMTKSIGSGRAVRVLHQDDINGIQAKYGPRTPGPHQTTVPDVQELRPATAAERIRAASLRPVFSGSDGPNAWVWRQSPRARQIVGIDSEVTMQLRNGPRL